MKAPGRIIVALLFAECASRVVGQARNRRRAARNYARRGRRAAEAASARINRAYLASVIFCRRRVASLEKAEAKSGPKRMLAWRHLRAVDVESCALRRDKKRRMCARHRRAEGDENRSARSARDC